MGRKGDFMFQNINGVAYINGQNGIYDGKINNNSVRYARNAVDNYKKTYSFSDEWMNAQMPKLKGVSSKDTDTFNKTIKNAQDFLSTEIPPLRFNMRYAENKAEKPDTLAVLSAAYEEMNRKTSVSVSELTKTLQAGVSEQNKDLVSADSLDLNKDGKIDVAEYGASILVEDMLSTDSSSLNAKNVTGEITDEGQINLLSFASKQNYAPAFETYKAVYKDFKLDEAKQEFLKDKNNLV